MSISWPQTGPRVLEARRETRISVLHPRTQALFENCSFLPQLVFSFAAGLNARAYEIPTLAFERSTLLFIETPNHR